MNTSKLHSCTVLLMYNLLGFFYFCFYFSLFFFNNNQPKMSFSKLSVFSEGGPLTCTDRSDVFTQSPQPVLLAVQSFSIISPGALS